MKKKRFSKYCLTVLFLLIAVLVVPWHAEAAKKPSKKTVKKLYTEFLETNASASDYFITLDINRDGVKELIISKPRQSSYSDDIYSIYTIKSKKVKAAGTVQEAASLNYKPSGKKKAVYYNKKYKAVRSTETGTYSTAFSLYQLSGTKLKERFRSTAIYNRTRFFQIKKGTSKAKTVSESTLNAFEKKYMKKQCKKISLVQNTKKNRTKKL